MKIISFDSYKYMVVTEGKARIILGFNLFELYELNIEDRSERLILLFEELDKVVKNGGVLAIKTGFN